MNEMKFFDKLMEKLGLAHTPPASEVHYINGAVTLPSPLTPDEEAEALAAFAAGDNDAKMTLIEHNLRLVVYVARRFESTGIGLEDLISIGSIGLIKAVDTYDPERSIKLATYATRCIENEILMYIRKNSGRNELSIDEPLSVDWDGSELLLSDILGGDEDEVSHELEQSEEKRIIREALSELDEREQLIISMRYGLDGSDGRTQKEVADMLGISQSYISRMEKRIISHLSDVLRNRL